MKMTIGEIVKAINASLEDQSDEVLQTEVNGVCFDTRKLTPGQLFIPLQGDHDGHDFIENAVKGGARATLWGRDHIDRLPVSIPALVVDDPLQAFQKLSRYYLTKINPRVIAITGSNGKTTTKDMIASVLDDEFNVTKTHDNFNNEIGVPYTILQMESNTDFLVVEMGMDRPGQLDFLSKLVSPDVAVITMIGEAHIEFFGTRDKIADAKMEITHGLKADGYFIYDGDEPLLRERAESLDFAKMTFGRNQTNDVYAVSTSDGQFRTSFEVNLWPDKKITIPMMGDYNVNNALAAIAVGKLFRIPEIEITQKLAHFDLTKNRTEWLTGTKGEKILSDVYNSNPTAAREVLTAFSQTPVVGRRIVVLGDMLELGNQSPQMHASLAADIDSNAIAAVYLIGKDMQALYEKLKPFFAPENLHYYQADQLQQLSEDLKRDLQPNDEVMLKASHGIHLEKIVAKLTA
ncbi:UDP-N-acetylmuramoyl-tripeptide--D-alanyl-D-alanine ligase [Lentilactobacillus farraginis]|uniref:UDP-N-acetylmuramoyl-tripeptide--D-alanyl-D-alanine ligase n=1 Tax=Lentilactobacillus farraginis DSM 18382 = JCM 14108 TaxID=1423743 RepID=X0PH74_9LACO|nr:UDP-N-acetylmuramoyl-tripeptide--D-alanyl-D-alanine ligase [Lentilactobacillus farraginis]KRM09614.1 UDP-N-acetylmuramoyl-tripeptide--D-alanyl-D-alanine ligase [Lentilactobacillus farraginis DSM 18382 = JCM 14108]GAF36367.1 UDP-N-acetylmuramoylalanyl-D-glutamyl-2,6-diaminopimelate-D-alanyl-D-alanine ligase [Lentilactobacillus farraginis DSM 18382 = JCM 14108]